MNRSTLVYTLMIVPAFGGLWGILRAGVGLRAPPDLSGAWETVEGRGRRGERFVVEQSGRYFEIRFANGRVLDLKLTGEGADGLHLAGGGHEWAVRRPDGGTTLVVRTATPGERGFTARRPRDASPPPAGSRPARQP